MDILPVGIHPPASALQTDAGPIPKHRFQPMLSYILGKVFQFGQKAGDDPIVYVSRTISSSVEFKKNGNYFPDSYMYDVSHKRQSKNNLEKIKKTR